jgi:hypothetical protein
MHNHCWLSTDVTSSQEMAMYLAFANAYLILLHGQEHERFPSVPAQTSACKADEAHS